MEIVKSSFTFLILCFIQVLVLNHITLLGCATPLLYIYFILLFGRATPKWVIIVCGFIMGLFMDMFVNTPGIAAASATFLGFIQPYLLDFFSPKDSADDLTPSIKSLGNQNYFYYVLVAVSIYTFLLFTIEAFNLYNWQEWILSIMGSTILTVLLIVVIENVKNT
ncbi:MAG: rod shape-determining protein MreD [Prevotella sp.]|nr:rod shape-determining protein MreD [Prevotella sp.]